VGIERTVNEELGLEDQYLRTLVRTWIARSRVNRSWRLVERIARFEPTSRLTVDCKFVRALDHISKRVVSRVPVPRAARAGLSIQQVDPYFPARQIGKGLRKELAGRCRLRGGYRHKLRRTPRCYGR
jgi:hypothetical protein